MSELAEESPKPSADERTVVRTCDVTRRYDTKGETVRALDGVSFEIQKGEFVAIAGPSGSGKSTLLNVIGALDIPTSGEVEIAGQALASLDKSALSDLRRDRIGFVFQAYNLIPVLTVLENVEYVMLIQGLSKAERHARAKDVLAAVGLDGKLDRRPNELSGGQQQRVAVARALAARPALILADEPTANLDSQTAEELIAMMAEINRTQGATFVFSTHDPKVMSAASRLIRIRDGKVESDSRRSEHPEAELGAAQDAES